MTNRRIFLKQTASLTALSSIIGTSGLNSLLTGCTPNNAKAIRINPEPQFTVSPNLYMQFMEPLGSTEPSVEGAWDYDRDDWRQDFIDCVKDLEPDVIRWGGIFNRYYKWREGIGPVEKRKWMYNYQWEGKETNRVGSHEIVDFCRRVGANPLLGVNLEGDGLPYYKNTVHGEDRTGTADEAAEWVAYCNEPTHAERSRNGNVAPFNVKLWQLGNESSYAGTDGFVLDSYLEVARRFANKMRAADPSISLIGWGDVVDCGKLIPGASLEGNEPWASKILQQTDDLFNYVAFHMMGIYPRRSDTVLKSFDYINDPAQAWDELIELGEIPQYRIDVFRNELRNAQSKAGLAVTEGHMSLSPYNTNTILRSWLSMAYHARSLNAYLRNGDVVKICTAADFNGARWTVNAVMMPEPRGNSFLLPVGHLMKWFNKERGQKGLSVISQPNELDIAATRSEDTIYLHVLNKSFDEAQQVGLEIDQSQIVDGWVLEMNPKDKLTHLDQSNPNLFEPVERKWSENWVFPAASVSIVKLKIKKLS